MKEKSFPLRKLANFFYSFPSSSHFFPFHLTSHRILNNVKDCVEGMDTTQSSLLAPFHAAITLLSPFLPPPSSDSQQLSTIDKVIRTTHDWCSKLFTTVSPHSSFALSPLMLTKG